MPPKAGKPLESRIPSQRRVIEQAQQRQAGLRLATATQRRCPLPPQPSAKGREVRADGAVLHTIAVPASLRKWIPPSSLTVHSAGRCALLLHVEFEDAKACDLAEAKELARSAGVRVVEGGGGETAPSASALLVGPGKAEELRQRFAQCGANLLLVNNDLSAGQQRNLEEALAHRVMSRAELIIQIFAQRARTFEGQLQVELAQLKHAQTRLVRGWSHLDRQKGGIGLRGGGEKQLELDQRMLEGRIKAVQLRLRQVAQRRQQGRRRRGRSGTVAVALVGYTNAGKSTLFNALTNAAVTAEDKLFATLDPTLRRLAVPGAGDVVLADTVGFVSRLPHTLIDAFKATLEEVTQADLLIHVMDAASPDLDRRNADVEAVLKDIAAPKAFPASMC